MVKLGGTGYNDLIIPTLERLQNENCSFPFFAILGAFSCDLRKIEKAKNIIEICTNSKPIDKNCKKSSEKSY
jgi:hypothetical protein